jgi:uncharacterized protein (DUF1697 family)
MPTYVAFLRAINLGQTRRFPMVELKKCLAEAGYDGVETHLATGNVRLATSMRSLAKVEAALEEAFRARIGFEVPTVVTTPAELGRLYADAVALGVTAQRKYVTFTKAPLPAKAADEIDGWVAPGEGARTLGRAVYWWIDHPSQAAKLSNARIEKLVGVATTRDLKVVATLADRWCP